ncbi:DUF4176 domain-containing protein [Lacticaseibacillus parahuelsenbergensis]|uniref:DUF4176 domain-containing protein n=1 Tax=Lacticaseibacillus parahuelsenbergensis TaxID=3068305 RepID=A0ABY9L4K2_9LACO|nr:DUF4176 domain-containing protein [Lacticaseibacillus sp. NCIMB 15471]WLV77386.1 DUF4176 domain-containing protein [Lacticaseibacillus sp. NCIMB 15471]
MDKGQGNDNLEMLRELLTAHTFDDEVQVDDQLLSFLVQIGHTSQLLRNVYHALSQKNEAYTYKPLLGSPIEFRFNHNLQQVTVHKATMNKQFAMDDFLFLLGSADAVYAPVLPLGTVLVLDKEMLAPEISKPFENKDFKVLITGRKIPLSGDYKNYLIDYVTRLWPYGELPETDPLMVSNMMIERVDQLGPTDEFADGFSENILHTNQLVEGRLSTAFMASALAKKLVAAIQNEGNETA